MRARIGGKSLANGREIAATLRGSLGKTRIGRRLSPIPSGGGTIGGPRTRRTTVPGEKIDRGGAMCRSRAMEGGLQTLFQGADQKPAHEAGIAKPDFGLGRMHIDIDLARIAPNKQD